MTLTVGGDDFNTGSIYEPPPLELYTKFSLQAYFLMFWGILLVQTFAILIIDKTTLVMDASIHGRRTLLDFFYI